MRVYLRVWLLLTELITLSKKEGPRQYDTAPDTFRLSEKLFAGDDSLAGANFCARTALDASIGIDVVDVAFRDSVNGTNGKAGATSNALVGDNVSHNSKN